jgi:voltage-gated potassium channel
MVVNWITCGWIMIYPFSINTDITSYYIKSFYWALSTLTTVGYGDITPTNDTGRIYTCLIMIIGVGMYGVIIGSITRMIANLDKHKDQSREKINDLILFMKHYNVPDILQESAVNHYSHIYSKRLSDNDEQIIADLPHALQMEMQIYMKIKLISSIAIFIGCPHECLKEVAMNLEQIYYSPNDMIINIGDVGQEMFILAHGSVDIFIKPGDRIATLHDGQIFGEIALIQETKRTANVQSKGYCDLYKLTSEKFSKIVNQFPQLLANIERTTSRRSTDQN